MLSMALPVPGDEDEVEESGNRLSCLRHCLCLVRG